MDNEALWRLLLLLLLQQLASFLVALMAFTASLVAKLGVNTPLFLSFCSYLTMALVFGSIFLYRRQKIIVPWYWYAGLAFADVQGNFLENKAFQFTSITSVTLLDGWNIAWVIGLTWYFLETHYSICQFLGVAICFSGLGVLLLSDSWVAGGGGLRPISGDMLVIAATLSFAISNVVQEFCVNKSGLVEVVSMFGLFGTLFTVCEVVIFEKSTLESVNWTGEIVFAFSGYSLAMVLLYAFVPLLLKMSGATLFNLSMLTSDMWAVVFRIFFYRQQVDWLYYLSFAIVVVGLVVYTNTATEPDHTEQTHIVKDFNEQSRLLHEEFLASRDNEVLALH